MGDNYRELKHLVESLKLHTVCESAACPNVGDCWNRRTATFMILGNVCTRPCGFCSVPRGEPEVLEDDEPGRVAEASARLGLKHVVITSVTRDDLPDGGADHFFRCILAVRRRTGAAVEVLTPDFLGDPAAIDRVIAARPDVFNHNTETVPRLYKKVRGRAEYQRTLDVLKMFGWSPSRCIPHGGHQMSLNIAAGLGLGGNESYPDLFQPYGGFPDGVRVQQGFVTMPELPGIGFEDKSDLYAEMEKLAA